jgi:glycerophosphoryl diester phosphodiesterase
MTIILGHRGGRGDGWPAENSLAAFARARREGADGVELDVRLSEDGQVVVLHDPTLARISSGADRRPVARTKHASMPRPGGEPIPTLAEALEVLRGAVVNVEVKADVPDRRSLAEAAAKAVRDARDVDVVFSSFDPRVILLLARAAPKVPRGMLVGGRTAPLATLLPLTMRRTVVAAHLETALATNTRVRRLRRLGLRLCTWTVNDVVRAKELVAAGVDWLITDAPGVMVQALRTNAQSSQ